MPGHDTTTARKNESPSVDLTGSRFGSNRELIKIGEDANSRIERNSSKVEEYKKNILSKFEPNGGYSLDKKQLLSLGRDGAEKAREVVARMEEDKKEFLKGNSKLRDTWFGERDRLLRERDSAKESLRIAKQNPKSLERREFLTEKISILDGAISSFNELLKTNDDVLKKFNSALETGRNTRDAVIKAVPVTAKEKRVAQGNSFEEESAKRFKEESYERTMAAREGKTYESVTEYSAQLLRKNIINSRDVKIASGIISSMEGVVEQKKDDSYYQLQAVRALSQALSQKTAGATWEQVKDPNSPVSQYSKEIFDSIERIAKMNGGKYYHDVVGMAVETLNNGYGTMTGRDKPVSSLVLAGINKLASASSEGGDMSNNLSREDTYAASSKALLRAYKEFGQDKIIRDGNLAEEASKAIESRKEADEKWLVKQKKDGKTILDTGPEQKKEVADSETSLKMRLETINKMTEIAEKAKNNDLAKSHLKSLLTTFVKEGVTPHGEGLKAGQDQERAETLGLVYNLATSPSDPSIIKHTISELEKVREKEMNAFGYDYDRRISSGAAEAGITLKREAGDILQRILGDSHDRALNIVKTKGAQFAVDYFNETKDKYHYVTDPVTGNRKAMTGGEIAEILNNSRARDAEIAKRETELNNFAKEVLNKNRAFTQDIDNTIEQLQIALDNMNKGAKIEKFAPVAPEA